MGVRFGDNGNEYRVVEVKDGENLVWAQVLDDDGEAFDGELHIISKSVLHDTPPRQKLDSQIVELQQERKDLFAQIAVLRRELTDFERGTGDRMVKLKQHKVLRRLDDFLAGRITHYVELSYGPPVIVSFEGAKTSESDSRNKLKLLSLFGRTNGDLEWGLNQYSDGSGVNTTVVPCASYSEAIKVAAELFVAHAARAMDPNDRAVSQQRWATKATEYGIAMSPDYLQDLEEREIVVKQKNIEDLELKLQELRKV